MSTKKQPAWLKREIQYVTKADESPVGAVELSIDLSKLQAYYEVPSDDPVFDMYQVEPQDVPFFAAYTDHQFDFDRYDYWLAAFTDNWEQTKRDKGFMGQYPPPKA